MKKFFLAAFGLLFFISANAQLPELKRIGEFPTTFPAFYDGLVVAQDTNRLYGFKSPSNQWVIPAKYHTTARMYNGMTHFKLSDKGLYGLIDKTGKELFPPKFKTLYSPVESHFLVIEDTIVKLIDNKGKIVFETEGSTGYASNGLIAIQDKETKLWGYKNIQTKQWQIQPTIKEFPTSFSDGLAVVKISKPTKWFKRTYLINSNGDIVGDTAYTINLYNAFAKVESVIDTTRFQSYPALRTRWLNNKGELIYAGNKYRSINNEARAGFMIVGDSANYSKLRLIDKSGIPIPGSYNKIYLSPNGNIVVYDEGQLRVIDKQGKDLVKPLQQFISSATIGDGEFIATTQEPTVVLLDKTGKEIKRTDIIVLDKLSDGLMAAKQKGTDKWGYVNEKLEWVIKPEFSYATSFGSGVAGVKKGSNYNYSLINKEGKLIFGGAEYMDVQTTNDGVIIVKVKTSSYSGEYKLFSIAGTELIDLKEYSGIWGMVDGLIRVQKGGLYGFIDKSGAVAIPITFKMASPFVNGFSLVKTDTDLYGFINKKGEMVIPARYSMAADFSSEGIAKVTYEKKHGYINKQGAEVTPLEFDDATSFSSGYAYVKKEGKYGVINTKGQLVLPYQYDGALAFANGLALTRTSTDKSGEYNLMDAKGKVVSGTKYTNNIFRALGQNIIAFPAKTITVIYKNPAFKK